MHKLSLALLLFLPLVAVAADKGTITGKFTANGKSYDLKYVYAWKEPSHFEKKQIDTFVLLSDQPVAADALRDFMTRSDLAENGKLNGIQVEFDPKGEITSANIYSEQFKKTHGSFSATGMHQWEKKTLSNTLIEGKLYLKHPDEFFDDTWDYTATFKAPVMAVKKQRS